MFWGSNSQSFDNSLCAIYKTCRMVTFLIKWLYNGTCVSYQPLLPPRDLELLLEKHIFN